MSDAVHDKRVKVVRVKLGNLQDLVETVVLKLALQNLPEILTLDRRRKPLNKLGINNHVLPMRKLQKGQYLVHDPLGNP